MIVKPSQTDIYSIAAENPAHGLQPWLRVTIARIAAEDPSWRRTYDRLLASLPDGEIRHPETMLIPGEDRTEWRPVFLTANDLPVAQAVGTLLRQAELLGVELPGANEIESAAAVVAAEIWMAALAADDLAYAAAKGPDAIASAAAILARVSGEPVMTMPLDPDWPKFTFPLDRVLRAAGHARAWVETVLGADAWYPVAARAVSDLACGAGGGSKTHEASLLLGLRIEEILPVAFGAG